MLQIIQRKLLITYKKEIAQLGNENMFSIVVKKEWKHLVEYDNFSRNEKCIFVVFCKCM